MYCGRRDDLISVKFRNAKSASTVYLAPFFSGNDQKGTGRVEGGKGGGGGGVRGGGGVATIPEGMGQVNRDWII